MRINAPCKSMQQAVTILQQYVHLSQSHIPPNLTCGMKSQCFSFVTVCVVRVTECCLAVQPAPMHPPANAGMPGFMGGGARPMLPSDYNLAPPPTNAYQTDQALAAAANSMSPMPMVSTLTLCTVHAGCMTYSA